MPRQRMIVPIFIPHQGCPYRCVFCNQNEISGAEREEDQVRLDSAFQTYLKSRPLEELPPIREAAFYGGTFTALPEQRQQFLLSSVQVWVDQGYIQSLRLSTHPGAVDDRALELLGNYSVETIELGVQSTDPEVLRRSGRGDTPESLERSVHLIRSKDYRLGLQLMLGLPGDSEEIFEQSVSDTLQLKPDFVRIYPALVVRGTALHEMYKKGEYIPWSLDRTVNALKMAIKRYEDAGIPVIRLGLHPEPSLLANIVDGPHHPALRSLVESRICFDAMSDLLAREAVLPERVTFKVPLRKISNYTGHRKENIRMLKEKFSIEELVFSPTPDLIVPELLV
jgi:histone acetyltransferase (RNA polymerase elongator complex component)